jgi:uncharacterized protein DUF4235
MPPEQQSNKSAQILYMPIGIVASLLAGLVARRIFQVIWKHATPGDEQDPPTPLESDYDFREILVAAAAQGVVFSLVKALVRRGGARAFQKWTGDWPGH